MKLAWVPARMRTGVDSVDRQHRRMIGKVNRLLEAIESRQNAQSVARILNSLSEEAIAHFRHEEAVMGAAKCPVRGVNRAAHRCFLREFAHIVRSFERDGPGPSFAAEVERLCCDWLADHICQCDAQLAGCVTRLPKERRRASST